MNPFPPSFSYQLNSALIGRLYLWYGTYTVDEFNRDFRNFVGAQYRLLPVSVTSDPLYAAANRLIFFQTFPFSS